MRLKLYLHHNLQTQIQRMNTPRRKDFRVGGTLSVRRVVDGGDVDDNLYLRDETRRLGGNS